MNVIMLIMLAVEEGEQDQGSRSGIPMIMIKAALILPIGLIMIMLIMIIMDPVYRLYGCVGVSI